MKNSFKKFSVCFLFAIIIDCVNTSFGQTNFVKLDTSPDSTYGYTAQNPLKLKKGNPQKSIDYSYSFLAGLKTKDDQALIYLSRFTTSSPGYKEPAIRLNNRFTGSPSGKSGLLDNYFFLTSVTKDTINVFVDIYNKGTLMVPIGLKYQQPRK